MGILNTRELSREKFGFVFSEMAPKTKETQVITEDPDEGHVILESISDLSTEFTKLGLGIKNSLERLEKSNLNSHVWLHARVVNSVPLPDGQNRQ